METMTDQDIKDALVQARMNSDYLTAEFFKALENASPDIAELRLEKIAAENHVANLENTLRLRSKKEETHVTPEAVNHVQAIQ